MAAIAPVAQDDQYARLLSKVRRELGPVILAALVDGRTEDIVVNPDLRLWVKRRGEDFEQVGLMEREKVEAVIGTVAAMSHAVINRDNPILESELALDGSRFEGIVPPVTRQAVFAIRVRSSRVFTLDDYERAGILTHKDDPLNHSRSAGQDRFAAAMHGQSHTRIIQHAIRLRKNILVVGATGSGKTTLLNAMLDAIAELTPGDRVIAIEDTPELQCPVVNYLDLRATDKVSMLDCLRASMRLKPTRIIVGEVRGAEAHTLLKAWNTGHPGGLGTIHANSAEFGLTRLESLIAEATSAPQQRLIADTVDLVVFVDPESSLASGRKVRDLLLVTGWKDGWYEVQHV
jgi:Flp pilus assembly CpaF family ATPase